MRKTTEKFIDEVNELKKEFMREFAEDMLSMDERSFTLMKKFFGLFETSMELTREQAETIDSMNHKLDLLLERSKKN